MNIEEILAALKAITDGAVGRSLTDEEVANYERLENDLTKARKDQEIRARQAAYETPVNAAGVNVNPPAPDNGLDLAFEAYMRTGKPNQDIANLRVNSDGPWNALETGTPSEGGYLVPDGFRKKLVEVKKAYGGLAREVENITTTTGSALEYPSLDDTANEGSITAEAAPVADGDDLAFGTVNLGSFKYTSAGAGTNLPLRVSVELVQDSAFDIQKLVSRALGTRIARKQAKDWTTGTGTTLPFGLVHAGLTLDHELATFNTITHADLSALEAKLDPEYEQNAKWVMNKATWVAIRDLVDGNDRPLVQPQAESGIGTQPKRRLLDYPVVIDQTMPNHNAASSNFVALGDLREAYVIRHVRSFVLVVDPYSRAVNGQIQYHAWERADGNIQNRKAYVFAKNKAS
jgi:HK97 family phage major capsid protein